MIRVITDSTSSIPRSLREGHGIELFSLFDVGQFEKRGLADQLVRRSVNLAHNVSS